MQVKRIQIQHQLEHKKLQNSYILNSSISNHIRERILLITEPEPEPEL